MIRLRYASHSTFCGAVESTFDTLDSSFDSFPPPLKLKDLRPRSFGTCVALITGEALKTEFNTFASHAQVSLQKEPSS